MATQLEHVNVTVRDVGATAKWLCEAFGWRIRWQGKTGESIHGGTSWHVGSDTSYVALYTPTSEATPGTNSYTSIAGLNHIAVVVDDLDGTEARVKALGFTTYSHADYEPGRRFYFDDGDGLEVEVVDYS